VRLACDSGNLSDTKRPWFAQNSPSSQVTLKQLLSSSDAGSRGNQQGP
jgi:hypothetical protein